MQQSQIFISYARANRPFVYKIYDDLLLAGYWVWMDTRLKAAEKWEPQIDENLRKSEIFVVFISSQSVVSDWVKHEGSMAFALNQRIVPVQIEPFGAYTHDHLPIWAKPIQLHALLEGSTDYEDKWQELKQHIGAPLPIRQHIEEMLVHFEKSDVLLDEVALALVAKHYHEFNFPKDKKARVDKMIRESRLRLQSYWVRYEQIQNDYEQEQKDNERLRKENERLSKSGIINDATYVLLAILVLGFLVYFISSFR